MPWLDTRKQRLFRRVICSIPTQLPGILSVARTKATMDTYLDSQMQSKIVSSSWTRFSCFSILHPLKKSIKKNLKNSKTWSSVVTRSHHLQYASLPHQGIPSKRCASYTLNAGGCHEYDCPGVFCRVHGLNLLVIRNDEFIHVSMPIVLHQQSRYH